MEKRWQDKKHKEKKRNSENIKREEHKRMDKAESTSAQQDRKVTKGLQTVF